MYNLAHAAQGHRPRHSISEIEFCVCKASGAHVIRTLESDIAVDVAAPPLDRRADPDAIIAETHMFMQIAGAPVIGDADMLSDIFFAIGEHKALENLACCGPPMLGRNPKDASCVNIAGRERFGSLHQANGGR